MSTIAGRGRALKRRNPRVWPLAPPPKLRHLFGTPELAPASNKGRCANMQRIMIIRHAEKPLRGRVDRSVCINGFHAKHELTVRGWQRAAALVRFFTSAGNDHPVSPPRSIFAAAATAASPSLRSQRTVEPLSVELGIAINLDHAEHEEADLAAAVLVAEPPVLIAWHHHTIPELVQRIAGNSVPCPAEWPDDRYDMLWTLDRSSPDSLWRFHQTPQRLFVHDRPDPI
jgi:hypothetical protein